MRGRGRHKLRGTGRPVAAWRVFSVGSGGMSSTAAADLWRDDKVAAPRAMLPPRRRRHGGVKSGCEEGIPNLPLSMDVSRAALPLLRWGWQGQESPRARRTDTKVTKRGEGRRPVVQAWCASGATGARRFSYQFLSRNSPSKIGSSLGETRKQRKKKDPGPFPLRGLGVDFLISILSLPLPLPKLFPQQFPPPSFTPSFSFRFRLEI